MTEKDVQDWLDAYGAAWINGDPRQVMRLFTDAARYRETPFDEPMIGRTTIGAYWQEGAADAQEDVEFTSRVWAVKGDQAFAGWQARFRRKASGGRVQLDGAFRLAFATERGVLLCRSLEEWWHRRET